MMEDLEEMHKILFEASQVTLFPSGILTPSVEVLAKVSADH
jgi:hypothetical protein